MSVEEAVRNAGRFYKEAAVDAVKLEGVKLEGGKRVCPQIRAIADGGMLVMGHIGLTPQSSGQQGGFKAQGRNAAAAQELIEDALAVEAAGAFALLVEAVPPEVCKIMRDRLTVPVYSIGAGGKTVDAFKQYVADARSKAFPADEHTYKMIDGELAKLHELLRK